MYTKNIELKPCPFCGGKDVILATVPSWPRPYYELICRDCNAVIQAKDKESVHDLWNRRYEPPNEPLTLDELREMDGEPVYMIDLTGGTLWNQWIIFQKSTDDGFIPRGGGWFGKENYGKTWLAYRRRPEEE